MKILLIIAGAIVVIVVVLAIAVFVIGSRLPQNHIASRSIRLDRSPSEVYATVRDFGSSSKWRPDVKSVEMLDATENGRIQFRELGSNGTITYELLDDVPDQQIVTRIVDRDLGYSGSWTYSFSPSGDGTTITITENGEVSNLIFRFMSYYFFGHTATIDAYLMALALSFGESAVPKDASH